MMNTQPVLTSQATRNIQFCIDKDEEASSIKADLIKLIHRPINEQDVRRFVRDYMKSIHRMLLASSSDAGYKIEDINWQEIADAWESERNHLKEM